MVQEMGFRIANILDFGRLKKQIGQPMTRKIKQRIKIKMMKQKRISKKMTKRT